MGKAHRSTAMEHESKCEDVEGVSFSQVSKLVTGWTLDFLFASLCRLFKEGKLDEFDQTLSTLEGKKDLACWNMEVCESQWQNLKNSTVNTSHV